MKLLTNCIAIMSTVFSENRRPHRSNRSSSEGPSNSITSALYLPQGPKQYTSGIPSAGCVSRFVWFFFSVFEPNSRRQKERKENNKIVKRISLESQRDHVISFENFALPRIFFIRNVEKLTTLQFQTTFFCCILLGDRQLESYLIART